MTTNKWTKYRHIPTGIIGELWDDGYIHFYNTVKTKSKLYHATVPQEFVLTSSDWQIILK